MASFVQNILWNSVEGFVEAGKRTAGGYAGDALIKAGDVIENSGRGVGTSIERKASAYGTSISGKTYQPSPKTLPSTARKPITKRSNSSPASTKVVAPSSKMPLDATKYPGKVVSSATGAAKKQITFGATGANSKVANTVGGAKSTVGGAGKSLTGAVGGGLTGTVGGAQRALGNTAGTLPKPYPNNVPYGSKPSPKPYSLNGSSYQPPPQKKSAVKPGQPKPFESPNKGSSTQDKKLAPYPGTDTLPGQGGRSPVRAKKYKPMERMAPPVEKGKMQHIVI